MAGADSRRAVDEQMAGQLQMNGPGVDDDGHWVDAVGFDILMDLAGVERPRPTVSRFLLIDPTRGCLVIDPTRGTLDTLCDWAADTIGKGAVTDSALRSAVSIRLSAIGSVVAERDRFVVRLVSAGVGIRAASELADSWIDFEVPGSPPERAFETAFLFGGADIASDLVTLIESGRVREIVYCGNADWTVRVEQGPQRAKLVDYLTLQAATSVPGVQLIKFELTPARPSRVVAVPNGPVNGDAWRELMGWVEERPVVQWPRAGAASHDLAHWTCPEVPDPFGPPEGPWTILPTQTAALLARMSRTYLPMTEEDYAIGSNPAPSPIWMASPTDSQEEDLVTVPYMSLEDVREGPFPPEPTRRVITTRDADGAVKPLADLSPAMRRWIYARASELGDIHEFSSEGRDRGLWWGSMEPRLPTGPFVCLPVIGSHFAPVAMSDPVWTGPGIIWFEPRFLEAEIVAALLTAGPLREQVRATSALDEAGRRVLAMETLTRLSLPKRVLPLIADELRAAYRAGDSGELERLANEVYTGNERAQHRARSGSGLFF